MFSSTGNRFAPLLAKGLAHHVDLNLVIADSTGHAPNDGHVVIWLAATEHRTMRWGLEQETAKLYWEQVGNHEFMTHLLSNMPQVPVGNYEHDRKRWLWLYEGDTEDIFKIAEAFYHVVRSYKPEPDTVLVAPALDLDIPEGW